MDHTSSRSQTDVDDVTPVIPPDGPGPELRWSLAGRNRKALRRRLRILLHLLLALQLLQQLLGGLDGGAARGLLRLIARLSFGWN